MTNLKFELEVGKIYLARDGKFVRIVGYRSNYTEWPFVDETGTTYSVTGEVFSSTRQTPQDLIREITPDLSHV
jgi:hypothetical protein